MMASASALFELAGTLRPNLPPGAGPWRIEVGGAGTWRVERAPDGRRVVTRLYRIAAPEPGARGAGREQG